MAKYIIGILIFLLSLSHSDAQVIKGYGLKVSASLSTEYWDYVDFPDVITPDKRWGFAAGSFVELFNHPNFSLVLEGDYIQKGLSQKVEITTPEQPDGTGEFMTLRPRIDYLSIYVLNKVRKDFSNVSPYLLVGPRFDIMLHKNPDGFQAVMDKFRATDFGLALGAGTEIFLRHFNFLAEFRFSPNISNSYSSDFLNVRGNSFEFLFGIKFKK